MSKQYLDELYLAYGSNVSIGEMAVRCPDAEFVGLTTLNGYKLDFMGLSTGYLTVEKSDDEVVVAAYRITKGDLSRLDYYEGYPRLYEHVKVTVNIDGKKYSAFFYKMNDIVFVEDSQSALVEYRTHYEFPSVNYLVRCVNGYKEVGMNIGVLLDRVMVLVNFIQELVDLGVSMKGGDGEDE